MQTELRKRIYADTRVMAFILLAYHYTEMDLFYMLRKTLRIRRGRGLLANDNPASTRKSRRIVGVFILGICAIPALGIKNRIIRYSIFHSILDTCISPKYRLSDH